MIDNNVVFLRKPERCRCEKLGPENVYGPEGGVPDDDTGAVRRGDGADVHVICGEGADKCVGVTVDDGGGDVTDQGSSVLDVRGGKLDIQ